MNMDAKEIEAKIKSLEEKVQTLEDMSR